VIDMTDDTTIREPSTTAGFVLLILPLLGVPLLWQAAWSAVLHRFSAPSWLTSLVGSLVVAWPIATALPVTG
jgi:hypothetical protein